MNLTDLFVGSVSAITGAIGVAAGLANWEQCYQLAKVQWLIARFGRTRMRWIYVGGGTFFIVLGVAIAGGFALR